MVKLFKVSIQLGSIGRAPEYLLTTTEIEVEEKTKSYIWENRRLSKNKLNCIDSSFTNETSFIGYKVYTLEEDLETSKKALISRVESRLEKLKEQLETLFDVRNAGLKEKYIKREDYL